MSTAENLISKAKSDLILDQPFFATLLLTMPIVEDNSVQTMATDGDSIFYNSDWVNSLSRSEVVFVLAHETLHVVFQHMCRREERSPNRWNQAADYVINQVLVDEKVGHMPQGGLLNPKLVKDGDGTAEGVYRLLPESAENKKPGTKGGSLDDVRDAGSHNKIDDDGNQIPNSGQQPDAATMAQKESEIRVRVTQAKNAAKMQGQLSAGLERLIDDLIKTRTDWRSILRRFITERAKSEYTFARPNRRWLADDINLPSLTGEKMGVIAIAVDCSGSISPDVLNLFNGEINGILEDVRPTEIKIVYFDSEVLRVDSITELPCTLKPIGGGGTAFSPIFSEINSWAEQPVACVVLTDLCCNDYGPQPDYPVLWASTDLEDGAEFGEVVRIGDE